MNSSAHGCGADNARYVRRLKMEKKQTCDACDNYTPGQSRTYGRCAINFQYEKDMLGNVIEASKHNAIRFHNETCFDFTPRTILSDTKKKAEVK
jgi:hypothetical protein